jgi:glutamate synthase domain-containing protein 2/rubredoxin
MARYLCQVCEYVYDEDRKGASWAELADDWLCPVCESTKSQYGPLDGVPAAGGPAQAATASDASVSLDELRRERDDLESYMHDIHRIAETGESVIEPMRTTLPSPWWDSVLIKGAQLAKIPLNVGEPVNTSTTIGPNADRPLVVQTPIYVTHMSFGALSREAKIALSQGSAAVGAAMCSGEGGILPESLESAYRYIFEYVPNRYSVSDENLKRVDAIEIKFGQSVKPGMGGHLPGKKVSPEIAAVRGFPVGTDIVSPSHFPDILTRDDLLRTVEGLREVSRGRPIGVKLAAGSIEADLEVALYARPDFVTIDGRAGATGAAPKFIKMATSVPTLFALWRARKYLDVHGPSGVSLLITGGLRISPDFAKAIAIGADAVAVGTAALMAIGCQQYRQCDTGRCPMGIATQDPNLRARLDVGSAAQRLTNYLRVSTEELCDFARLTGNDDVHGLSVSDLCTTDSEIAAHTSIEHV